MQNDSIVLPRVNVGLITKTLLVCAAVLLLFLGLASKAGADPASGATGATLTQLITPVSSDTTSVALLGAPPTNVPITYDDASCSICHSNNVQLEHQKYSGCSLCHGNAGISSMSSPVDIPGAVGKKSCGTDVDACHGPNGGQAWHGSGVEGAWAVDGMNSSHATMDTLTATPMDAQTSCGGYDDGTGTPTCHSAGSTQSNYYFGMSDGAYDLAAAHADYYNAVKNKKTGPGVTPSTAITASASACGICHDKNSTLDGELKPVIAAKVNAAGGPGNLTCKSCHDGTNGTYVPLTAYAAVDPSLPSLTGNKSLCYKANSSLATSMSTSAAPGSLLSGLTSHSTTSAALPAAEGDQVDALIGQLSPELQAQLSGVTGQQQQLSAGTLSMNNLGIPDSALPATSISKMPLFFR